MVEMIKAEIIKIIKLSDRLKIFRLKWDEIQEFNFKAGQFINLSSNDFLDENGKLVRRAYSIVNSSHEKKYLELCIAKQTYFSKFMNENVKEGDILNIEGPFGHFLLKECTENITFIAGGTGIAPMISFIRTLKKEKCEKNIWLFYSVRKKEDLAYLEELKQHSEENPKFHFIYTCTRENKEWNGRKERLTEFLHEYIITNRDCYICGPPQMDQSIKEKLKELGVKKENIFAEKWG